MSVCLLTEGIKNGPDRIEAIVPVGNFSDDERFNYYFIEDKIGSWC